MLVVFDLSFCERRLIVDAPIDGARAFVDKAAFDKAREQPRRFGFVVVGHRDVRVVPLAEDTEPLKIARLSLQSIRRKFATCTADAERRHVFLLLA